MVSFRPRWWAVGVAIGILGTACTPAPLAPTVPVRTATPRPLYWRRIDHPSLRGSQTNFFINGLAAGDRRHSWFAAGYLIPSSTPRHGAIWTSRGGRTWRRETVNSLFAGERFIDIARRGEMAVAYGLSPHKGRQRSIIWKREPTGIWRPVAGMRDEFGSYPDGGLEGVISTSHGFLAFGGHPDSRTTTGSVGVWRSSDGVLWKAEMALARKHDSRYIARAWSAAVHEQVTVVVGERFPSPAGGNPEVSTRSEANGAIWTERDGRWTSVSPRSAGLGGKGFQQVADIAWFRGRFVAVGRQQDGPAAAAKPALWVSRDGRRWRPFHSAAFDLPVSSGGALLEVEEFGKRLVVGGELDSVPFLWSSGNGSRWRVEPLPAELWRPQGTDVTLRLEAGQDRLLVAVNGPNQARLWAQTDGRWTNVSAGRAFPAPGSRVEVVGIARGPAGYVAVGNEKFEGRVGTGRVWISSDGSTWTPVPGPFPSSQLQTIAATPSAYVVVGTVWEGGFTRAAAWHSVDGRRWRREVLSNGPSFTSAAGVVSVSGGWILLMNTATAEGNEMSAWSSEEGLRWDRLGPLGERGEIGAGLCASDTTVLAIGHRPGAELGEALAWRLEGGTWTETLSGIGGVPRACATSGTSEVVLVTDTVDASRLWYRDPGTDWSLAHVDTSLPHQVLGLTTFDGGFLAVGSVRQAGNEEFNVWGGGGPSHWTTLGGTVLDLGEATFERGLAVATDGEVAVAGGLLSTGAAFWIGPAP